MSKDTNMVVLFLGVFLLAFCFVVTTATYSGMALANTESQLPCGNSQPPCSGYCFHTGGTCVYRVLEATCWCDYGIIA
jgi:hypothetical protein